jgi:hypothetical protein
MEADDSSNVSETSYSMRYISMAEALKLVRTN